MSGGIGIRIDEFVQFIRHDLWTLKLDPQTLTGRALGLLQFSVMLAQGFVRDMLLLRASALTYITVLSLIPLIAVMVSIANAFGVTADFAEAIVDQFAAGVPEAREQLFGFVHNFNFAALGTLGSAVLFLTTVLAISNIERAFNAIWGVSKGRTWARMLPDYLAVIVVAPILAAVALSLGTALKSQFIIQYLLTIPVFSDLYKFGIGWVPTLVLGSAFAFLIWFLPNTRVRPQSALLGGLLAAVLVFTAQSAYVGLQVGVARANALFGTLAALPLLFVWVYCFWAIVLFGAEVAFAYQNLDLYRRDVQGRKASPADREAIALCLALQIARTFRERERFWTADALANELQVPVRTVRDLLDHLERHGIVSRRLDAYDDVVGVQLGSPADQLPVVDVIASVRGTRSALQAAPEIAKPIEDLLAKLDAGEIQGAGGQTLADLLAKVGGNAPSPGARVSSLARSVDPSAARG